MATVQSANGRNQIVVTHAGASAAWELVDVQATYDGGVTWVAVRGWTQKPVTGEVMTAFDYEAPGGVPVTYRARATRHASGLLVTGDWKLSSPITWAYLYTDECHMWLKDPDDASQLDADRGGGHARAAVRPHRRHLPPDLAPCTPWWSLTSSRRAPRLSQS